MTLFMDRVNHEEWKKKASEIGLKCAISTEAEKWFEEGLIGKGEAIDDYYLNLNKELKNIKPVKIDLCWDQNQYDLIFLK